MPHCPDSNTALVPVDSCVHVLPTPSSRRVDLASLDDVRLEMAKVYRAMKDGDMQTQDGTRLVYVLAQIGKLIEVRDVAKRLEALETVLKART